MCVGTQSIELRVYADSRSRDILREMASAEFLPSTRVPAAKRRHPDDESPHDALNPEDHNPSSKRMLELEKTTLPPMPLSIPDMMWQAPPGTLPDHPASSTDYVVASGTYCDGSFLANASRQAILADLFPNPSPNPAAPALVNQGMLFLNSAHSTQPDLFNPVSWGFIPSSGPANLG